MSTHIVFKEVEKFLSEEGYLDDVEKWDSVDVDYHPPRVERLYTKIGSIRVCLHKIHPCDPKKALLHPHPWPASFKIYRGMYLSEVGSSVTAEPPKESVRVYLGAGSMKSMTNPDDWHYVAPIDEPVYSVMINGIPYENINPGVEKATKKLWPLSISEKTGLLKEFKELIENSIID
ncbi:MAG: hypothetical protein P8J32_00855 [bacterium]|nr:hypothetical protein [bacterium]